MIEYLSKLLPKTVDGAGAYGSIFGYSFTIAVVGSAFFIFIHLWIKGRLDMDEGPKMQMMMDQEEIHE